MVERVARAICGAAGGRPCGCCDGCCDNARAARAAIAAMREPSLAMLDAAAEHGALSAWRYWRVMIDAALQPEDVPNA